MRIHFSLEKARKYIAEKMNIIQDTGYFLQLFKKMKKKNQKRFLISKTTTKYLRMNNCEAREIFREREVIAREYETFV